MFVFGGGSWVMGQGEGRPQKKIMNLASSTPNSYIQQYCSSPEILLRRPFDSLVGFISYLGE